MFAQKRLAIRHWLEQRVPEKRLFLRTDSDTRFVRLTPFTQIFSVSFAFAFVVWALVASAIVLLNSVGTGNFRDQARRDQALYETRLNDMAAERDQRVAEAISAQQRFNTALGQVSQMQSQLLAAETDRMELQRGMEVLQDKLAQLEIDYAANQAALSELRAGQETSDVAAARDTSEYEFLVGTLANRLNETALERDTAQASAEQSDTIVEELNLEIELMAERNDHIFRQLEDAMSISVEPLNKMFRAAGLRPQTLIDTVRRGYGGQGGPLTPLNFSTSGAAQIDPATERANSILGQLDRLNIYRIAAEKAPFSLPVRGTYRFTSGFGRRWGRMHNGTDFAGKTGTPIVSTADGVVIHAGWQSGYGRLIKIQHEFGIETRYAHLSKIRVRVGQRVERGQRIGDMGNSGRSTGTHLHYEVRVNGKPINPMIYIRAGNDVF